MNSGCTVERTQVDHEGGFNGVNSVNKRNISVNKLNSSVNKARLHVGELINEAG